MNFQQLKYLVAVDEHRNFSRASEACEVAQSTMSKEIQKLEREFDIIIFDRSRYPVTPTMKGEDLVEQAKAILKAQQEFFAIARQKSNVPAGNFHLGILPTLAPYLLPLFIRSVSEKYPELNLQLFELTSQEMLKEFGDNNLDGAIGISPFIKEGYYEENLFSEDFVLYVHQHHPLAAKNEVRWSDIPLNELILHEAFKPYLKSSENLKNKGVLSPKTLNNIDYQSGSLETIRKIIDRNGGLTLLPNLACSYMGKRRIKMVRPIVDPVLSRMVIFITPRGFEKKRITKVLKKEIIRSLPEP